MVQPLWQKSEESNHQLDHLHHYYFGIFLENHYYRTIKNHYCETQLLDGLKVYYSPSKQSRDSTGGKLLLYDILIQFGSLTLY